MNIFNSQNELKNLQDAFEELDMVLDDDEMFPFLMGEIFLYQNLEDTKVSKNFICSLYT